MTEPALTSEEWERAKQRPSIERTMSAKRDHAFAALCLYGHPFGFTHEDVRRHRHDARYLRDGLERQGEQPSWDFPAEEMESKRIHAEWHENIADRIEALLPPDTGSQP